MQNWPLWERGCQTAISWQGCNYNWLIYRVKDFHSRVVAHAGDVAAVRWVRIVIVVSLKHDYEDLQRR